MNTLKIDLRGCPLEVARGRPPEIYISGVAANKWQHSHKKRMQLSNVFFCGSGPDACGAPRATHLFLNVRFAYAKRLLLEACSQKTYKTQRVFYIAPRLLALYKHKGPACARKRKRIPARPVAGLFQGGARSAN